MRIPRRCAARDDKQNRAARDDNNKPEILPPVTAVQVTCSYKLTFWLVPSWGLSAGTNRAIISQELKMRVAATFQSDLSAAPKCTLRLRMSYPRVGVNLLPSNARPCLFGCD